jgi:ABC-type glycerol-3-phosphate transport system substrate-binding protein
MKTFVIIPALVLAAGLTLAGCGGAKAPAAKPAVTITQTVTAKPAPAKPKTARTSP